jgi:chromosome segregation ATPase
MEMRSGSQESLSTVIEQFKKYDSKVLSLNKQNKDLQSRCEEFDKTLFLKDFKISDLEFELSKIQDELDNTRSEVDKLKIQVDNNEKMRNEEIATRENELKDQLESAKRTNDETQAFLAQTQQEMNKLKVQKESFEREALTARSTLLTYKSISKRQNQELQVMLDSATARNNELQAALDSTAARGNELESENLNLNNSFEQFRKEQASYSEDLLTQLNVERQNHRATLYDLEEARTTSENLRNENEQLSRQLGDDRAGGAVTISELFDQLAQERQNHRATLSELDETREILANLRNENEQLSGQLGDDRAEAAVKTTELFDQLYEERQIRRSMLHDLDVTDRMLLDFNREKAESDRMLQTLQDFTNSQMQHRDQLKRDNILLRDDIDRIYKQSTLDQEKIASHERDLATLHREIEGYKFELTQRNKAISTMSDDNSMLHRVLSEQFTEIQNMESKIEVLTANNHDLENRNQHLGESVRDLLQQTEQQDFTASEFQKELDRRNNTITDLTNRLDEFQRKMTENAELVRQIFQNIPA